MEDRDESYFSVGISQDGLSPFRRFSLPCATLARS
jgi:hypothetical protein